MEGRGSFGQGKGTSWVISPWTLFRSGPECVGLNFTQTMPSKFAKVRVTCDLGSRNNRIRHIKYDVKQRHRTRWHASAHLHWTKQAPELMDTNYAVHLMAQLQHWSWLGPMLGGKIALCNNLSINTGLPCRYCVRASLWAFDYELPTEVVAHAGR